MGGARADRNPLVWAFDSRLGYTGPFASRPADVFALGFMHASFSSDFAANARTAAPAEPAPSSEQVVEATYSAGLGDHVRLQPGAQYIRRPGGSSLLRDAVLFTLRVSASF